ncbi:Low-density lipoprotein receptor domain class A [Dictyocaulus viviparus]|uniref:Low-density lipoprotein receptor domain class A n=1 Tax=Dictyocaulus viviparus TaxID=29172 RepID=A0A0D8X830_DICVI|nr:Low-density lipoprotein receptor domain class A [Dictyocaulus viviparus]
MLETTLPVKRGHLSFHVPVSLYSIENIGIALCEIEGTLKCSTTPNCILPQWILDGKDDCGDGSDEGDITDLAIPKKCETSEFRCQSGECIDGQLVLDGISNCFDKSDEGNISIS